uniref:Uncharacterized protein n=1 Tax=Amphimedon queenslandica TaxID=400682 RepID=A0A1X7VDZ9_AMPQE
PKALEYLCISIPLFLEFFLIFPTALEFF